MPEQIFRLTHNEQPLKPNFTVLDPGEITGELIPRAQWTGQAADTISATLEVFRTPIEEYVDLEDELERRRGEVVNLGELRTHELSGDNIVVEAEVGNIYDIFCVARLADGTGGMCGGGRYAVTNDPEYEVPDLLTFDEAKFFGFVALGLKSEDASALTAKVEPMTAWGNSGRFVIAGLVVANNSTEENPFNNAGMMVSHNGQVEFYHGRSAADTLNLAQAAS